MVFERQRQREIELHRDLREMRTAIDKFKDAVDQGLIPSTEVTPGSEGYPEPEGGGEKSGAKNQPPRPFWAIDDATHLECDEYAHEWIDSLLRGK